MANFWERLNPQWHREQAAAFGRSRATDDAGQEGTWQDPQSGQWLTPIGSTEPQPDWTSYIKDPRVRGVASEQIVSTETREGENRAQIDAAVALLEAAGLDIENLFTGTREDIQETLPLQPYGDKELQAQKDVIYGEIDKLVSSLTAQASQNLTSRGFTGGGSQAMQAWGGIQGAGIESRSKALGGLLEKQGDINRQRQELVTKLLGEVDITEAGFMSQLGLGAGAITASYQKDPGAIADIMGDALSASLGIENKAELLSVIENMTDEDFFDKLLEGLPMALAAGLPSAGGVGAFGTLFSEAFKD